jgi:hypothetical protein
MLPGFVAWNLAAQEPESDWMTSMRVFSWKMRDGEEGGENDRQEIERGMKVAGRAG